MKRTLTILASALVGLISAYSQNDEINEGFGIGFQLSEYQNDFGIGANITSPYFLEGKAAIRLKGNFMYRDGIEDGKNTWYTYTNFSLGVIGVGGNINNFIRLYGEGGGLLILPSGDFSTSDQVFGGYGHFGFEFFFMKSGNYFIEIGGVGTGARAELMPTEPIYSNGFYISTGIRFILE